MSRFQTIILSKHAVERFRDRVRPALDLTAAEVELARLALAGELTAEAPVWHACATASPADRYLVIADVILPLRSNGRSDEFVAVTCIPKALYSETARKYRNRAKARRAAARRRSGMRHPLAGSAPRPSMAAAA